MGGADFGGGVWHLLATGPRARAQRDLIARAIGPIWEANHVWLILVVVILFTAFPPAFAAIATALHIPITFLLVAIVLRGSAFAFQSHEPHAVAQSGWETLFALASLASPVMIGVIVGAIMSGEIRVEDGLVLGGFFRPWLGIFPFAVGAFALALFAFLAAVYLTVEAERDAALQDDFRRRALAAAVLVGALALAVFVLAGEGAPLIRRRLAASAWTWPLQLATGAAATGAIAALLLRRYRIARVLAAGQVALIVWGWALAQFPYLLVPDLTITGAAGPEKTLRLLTIALAGGAVLLFPSFTYLYRVFKAGSAS
jgi:cytochrome d ubiquinol oxidase subunit II